MLIRLTHTLSASQIFRNKQWERLFNTTQSGGGGRTSYSGTLLFSDEVASGLRVPQRAPPGAHSGPKAPHSSNGGLQFPEHSFLHLGCSSFPCVVPAARLRHPLKGEARERSDEAPRTGETVKQRCAASREVTVNKAAFPRPKVGLKFRRRIVVQYNGAIQVHFPPVRTERSVFSGDNGKLVTEIPGGMVGGEEGAFLPLPRRPDRQPLLHNLSCLMNDSALQVFPSMCRRVLNLRAPQRGRDPICPGFQIKVQTGGLHTADPVS